MKVREAGFLVFCTLIIVVSIVAYQITSGPAQSIAVATGIASVIGCGYFAHKMRRLA